MGRKALFALVNRPSLRSILDRLQRQGKSLSLRQQLAAACGVPESAVRAEIHNVEHHDAHLACGYLLSPFDEAAILSIDGMGDFVSTVTARGNGRQIEKLAEVFYPHSLGFLYNAVTIYLGFPHYGDEYKVMGLAPYGQPEYVDEFRRIIFPKGDTFELNLDYFTHVQNGISMSWDGGYPKVEPFHSRLLEQRLGPPRDPTGGRDAPARESGRVAAARDRRDHLPPSQPTLRSGAERERGAGGRMCDELGGQRQGHAGDAVSAGVHPGGCGRQRHGDSGPRSTCGTRSWASPARSSSNTDSGAAAWMGPNVGPRRHGRALTPGKWNGQN